MSPSSEPTVRASPPCSRCSTAWSSPPPGTVTVFGAPLTEDALEDPAFRREFRSRVGFVFQEADVQLFCSNARDELAFGPLQLGLDEEEVERRVREVAEQLRIEKLLDRAPYTLSGGEKKRLAIGSVLTMQPQVLLLDEPTSALDPRSQVWLLEGTRRRGSARGARPSSPRTTSPPPAESADRMVVLSEDHTIVRRRPPRGGARPARAAPVGEPHPRARAPARRPRAPAPT